MLKLVEKAMQQKLIAGGQVLQQVIHICETGFFMTQAGFQSKLIVMMCDTTV